MNKLILRDLPYSYLNLKPVISEKIMSLHHDKHHLAYVNGANIALEKLQKSRMGDIDIDVKAVLRDLSFNLNGHLLHELFWDCMRVPIDSNLPGQSVTQLLINNFGSFEVFKKEFSQAAVSVEGSGWAVLEKAPDGSLVIVQVEKHNLMQIHGFKPVLVLDVWEHAYYLDYLNNRAEYVSSWWKVVNWENVEKQLAS